MSNALWSSFTERLLKALKFLAHSVKCENLPIGVISSNASNTIAGSDLGVHREIELNNIDLAIAIEFDNLGGPGWCAIIQLDRFNS